MGGGILLEDSKNSLCNLFTLLAVFVIAFLANVPPRYGETVF